MQMRQEQVEVRVESADETADGAAAGGKAPTMFVWRGRLYVVHEALDRWQTSDPWWREPEDVSARMDGELATPALSRAESTDVWRVVAGAGRGSEPAVFDLVHRRGGPEMAERWTLVRTLDRLPAAGARS